MINNIELIRTKLRETVANAEMYADFNDDQVPVSIVMGIADIAEFLLTEIAKEQAVSAELRRLRVQDLYDQQKYAAQQIEEIAQRARRYM